MLLTIVGYGWCACAVGVFAWAFREWLRDRHQAREDMAAGRLVSLGEYGMDLGMRVQLVEIRRLPEVEGTQKW